MRLLLVLSLACLMPALLLTGCGGKEESRSQTIGGITATLIPNPDPPKVGHDSGFSVRLEQGGQPVTGATVNFQFIFTGLNQTGPSGVGSEGPPGTYTIQEASMGMGGKWEAQIAVTHGGGTSGFVIPFTVAK